MLGPENSGLKATTADFAVFLNTDDRPIAGKNVTVNLVEIADDVVFFGDNANFDRQNPLNADNPQFNIVGIATYTFTSEDDANIASSFFTNVEVELNDFLTFDPGVDLKPNTRYLLAASYVDNNNNIRHLIGNQTPGKLNLAQYYAWSTFIFDALDGLWFSGFVGGSSPVMNMTVEMANSIDEKPLPEHSVKVFPNPAPADIFVDLNFDQPSKGILILANIEGKVLEIKEFSNLQQDRMSFNTKSLANGTYLVRVATGEGTKTSKVIVQK